MHVTLYGIGACPPTRMSIYIRLEQHLLLGFGGNKAQPSHADPSVRLPSTSPLCGVGKYGIEIKKPMTACFPELGK